MIFPANQNNYIRTVPGLVLDYDASRPGTLLTGSKVGTWKDWSANGYDAAQATDAYRPVWADAQQNGRPAVTLATSAWMRYTLPSPISQPTTWFCVGYNPGGAGVYKFAVDGAGAENRQLVGYVGLRACFFAGTLLEADSVVSIGWHVITARFNGAASFVRVDGLQAPNQNPGANACGGWTVGARYSADASFFGNAMGRLLLYSAAVSSTDISRIEKILSSQWGIPVV